MRLRFSFRGSLVIWSLLVGGFLFLVVKRSSHVPHSTQARYDKLVQEAEELHIARKSGDEKELAKQVRKNVIKRMWLSEKQPRLEIELQGSKSEVGIVMCKSDARLHETFYDVHGTIQQELFFKDEAGQEYVQDEKGNFKKKGSSEEITVDSTTLKPMQRFRYFESEHAIYDYHTHTLVGYDVNFWIYTADGHALITDRKALWPESSGSAASMTMCHEGSLDTLQFSAENLNMHMSQGL